MKTTGNTILITGGGSGIGRGLAEAFHRLGNQVIIAGRRRANLDETIAANPGMQAIELDIGDPQSIAAAARELIARWPSLNVLINNAGVMHIDDLSQPVDDAMLVSTLTTNVMGPIRLTGALVEHLKQRADATIINVSSVLGFVPMAMAGVYSSTKAAMHSYTQSLRYKLKDTSVRVVEIAPPWVQTDLLNSKDEPRAMPLAPFIEQTMHELGTDAEEALVEVARPLRNNAGPNEAAFVTQFNDMFAAG
ncbi:SDR family NAD(P)-dependent oxidoreductase [Paraburkholderia sp. BCC1876]|uniref:SDR family oxidoreductase n=1 Tax=Paraburkholderia sp. BCC1876 TaxID=2676303 RepID=UPI001592A652|nr:SDR family NAD(P)-dependent oxidoreductase [Paraburkholderia sp. BCC1876]